MPIFINYSQKDKGFVDNLAMSLVAAKHHVWIDRWELNVGDSLTQRIEGALTESSAILVILSKNSTKSDWCKRELSAGLVRELEEKRVLVMPCVIDDCKIPLFLRDKLHANFCSDPDGAFDLLNRSLAKISNPLQGRIEQPKFHTDWSLQWRLRPDLRWEFKWTFIDHGHDWPYVILSHCFILCDELFSLRFSKALADRKPYALVQEALEAMLVEVGDEALTVRMSDHREGQIKFDVASKKGRRFRSRITFARLGTDTGLDTVIHLDNHLRSALGHTLAASGAPPIKRGKRKV